MGQFYTELSVLGWHVDWQVAEKESHVTAMFRFFLTWRPLLILRKMGTCRYLVSCTIQCGNQNFPFISYD